MNTIERTIRDVVIANRILALNKVIDAYGHVSMRHPERPDRYFLAHSVSPAIVEIEDIIEFHLDGTPVNPEERRELYVERFIHGGVYEKRPDAKAALHSHAEDLLPFSISRNTRLRPVIQSVGDMGDNVPVWDIADKFGDETTLLVSVRPTCVKNCLRENVMVYIDHMADVRISIGCFNSHRLNTLNAIMPTSIGSWLRNAARPVPNSRSDVRCATQRL